MSRAPSPAVRRLSLVALCLIWGTTWAAIQIGLEGIPPLTGISVRFSVAGLVLLIAALAAGVPLGKSARERRLWVVNGLLSFTTSYIVVYWAEQSLPSGLTAILFATYPLFVMLLSHLWIHAERVQRPEIWTMTLSFLGVAVIYSEDLTLLAGAQAQRAALLMLISPFVSALASVAVKRWGSDLHPLSMTAAPMMLAGAVTALLALAFERDATIVWDATSVGALAYLTIFGTIVTFSLYFWLLRHMAVRRLALVAYIVPIVAVAIGVLRGEPMTLRIAVGATLVVAGVALTSRQRTSTPRQKAT